MVYLDVASINIFSQSLDVISISCLIILNTNEFLEFCYALTRKVGCKKILEMLYVSLAS